MIALIVLVISTLLSAFGVRWMIRIALANKMIDIPNARSSHTVPTPRGGGLAIVIIVIGGSVLLGLANVLAWNIVGAVAAGGLVAYIGYRDDQGGLSPRTRALVHFAAAIIAVILLGGMPPLDLGFTTFHWAFLGNVVAVVGIVWLINLYNFMDGIDGLAGSEAVFVFGVTAVMLASVGINDLALLCVLLVGACLGFLRWNWHPAKIFMGDVASGFLGYMIAIMAIASGHQAFSLWVWLLLPGVFVVDTTITLLRRVIRREKWYEPHRSHAYQHLTRRWQNHALVTGAVMAINLLWLTPLAREIEFNGASIIAVTTIAFVPLIGLALYFGAGRR